MMRGQAAGIAAFGAALMCAPVAHADVTEVHVGVLAHDICVTVCKNAWKEPGPAVEFAVNFDSPHWLNWAGAPQPYAVASINTAGATSFGGVGLEWRWQFAHNWALQPGLGYVIHNGEINNPFANGTPEAAKFNDEHLLLGSRDLFRVSLGLTRELPGPWEGQLFYSHLSHGQILGHGRNQGLDQLGVRLGYRFGE
jgi:lipid A 3-O-deacylase